MIRYDHGMLRNLLMSLWLLTLTACGANVQVPEDSFYRLVIDDPLPRAAAGLPRMIGIDVRAVAPIYRDRSLLYSESAHPSRLQRYHYHHWIDAPPRLLQHVLLRYLQTLRPGDRWITSADQVRPERQLRVGLERFEHLRDAGRVVVELSVTIVGQGGAETPVQRRLRAEQAVAGNGMTGVVAAYERAVAQLAHEIGVILAEV